MNALQKLNSTVKSAEFWQVTIGAGCLVTTVALLILGAQSVHFTHFSTHPFYNTHAAFDMAKTVGYLAGAGAVCGLGCFLLKKIAGNRLNARIEGKAITQAKTIRRARAMHRILSAIALVGGLALIIYGMYYISNLPHHEVLGSHALQAATHMDYLANEKQIKEIFAGIAVGGFLFSWGLLETARHMSNGKK